MVEENMEKIPQHITWCHYLQLKTVVGVKRRPHNAILETETSEIQMRDVVCPEQILQLSYPGGIFICAKSGKIGFIWVDAHGHQYVLLSRLQVWMKFGAVCAFDAKVFGAALSDVDWVVRGGTDSAWANKTKQKHNQHLLLSFCVLLFTFVGWLITVLPK